MDIFYLKFCDPVCKWNKIITFFIICYRTLHIHVLRDCTTEKCACLQSWRPELDPWDSQMHGKNRIVQVVLCPPFHCSENSQQVPLPAEHLNSSGKQRWACTLYGVKNDFGLWRLALSRGTTPAPIQLVSVFKSITMDPSIYLKASTHILFSTRVQFM